MTTALVSAKALARWVPCVAALSGVFAEGCSPSGAAPPTTNNDQAAGARGTLTTLAVACTDTLESVYTPPTDLPAYDATRRGDVVRCAVDRTLSIDELEADLSDVEHLEVRSSVRVYRIAYRTERLLGHEGLTTAVIFLPDRPIAPRAPVVVTAHGFVGAADACRFSTQYPFDEHGSPKGQNPMDMALTLSSYGYPVIAPDYPGWTPGVSPSLFLSEDVAHSVLDGTRAMRQLLTAGGTSEDVVLVGHSEGGHAVLSAQALAASYGLAGRLAAVVPFAPLWLPGRVWGAVLSPATGFTTKDNASLLALAMLYFNTHAELYDGPGSSLLLYKPATRDAVAKFFDATAPCFAGGPEGGNVITRELQRLGATTSDFIDPTFLDSIGPCGLTGDPNCATEPAATWLERFRADRPPSDPKGGDILLWLGREDGLATPALSQCGVDKITSDFSTPGAAARFTVCGDSAANHETILGHNLTWTAQWIAARTLGAPEPAACAGLETLRPDDGATVACADVPGNTD